MAETISGGYYLSGDGKTYHDANGKEVPKRSDAAVKAAAAEATEAAANPVAPTGTPLPKVSKRARKGAKAAKR